MLLFFAYRGPCRGDCSTRAEGTSLAAARSDPFGHGDFDVVEMQCRRFVSSTLNAAGSAGGAELRLITQPGFEFGGASLTELSGCSIALLRLLDEHPRLCLITCSPQHASEGGLSVCSSD